MRESNSRDKESYEVDGETYGEGLQMAQMFEWPPVL